VSEGTIGRRAYFGALLILMAAVAGGVFCNGLFFIAQPYQLNYGEGLVAWQALHITDSARAYAPMDHYPFVAFQYPPLFHLATRAAGATTGGDLLKAGRIVSLVSAALLCVVIGWTTFHALPHRAAWPPRLLAAGFAAALPTALYNFQWTWLARVDTLAVLLSFIGVALFAACPRSPWVQILAALLMTAALFTRQTAIAAPLACILTAFLLDRRSALRLLLAMTILGGGVLGWLTWWTHGQILLHLFRYNQTAFSISRSLFGFLMNARWMFGPLVMAAGASVSVLLGRRGSFRANRHRRTILLLSAYSILAGLTTLAFGKEGSDTNYFLEWNVSLAPLAGIFLFRLRPNPADIARWRPVWLAALAVPLLILSAGIPDAHTGWLRLFGSNLPADRKQLKTYFQMLDIIGEARGPVFSEDMNLLYKAGKDIPAEPAMIQYLATAGMWNERPFVRMIQEHRFPMIVAMVNRKTADILSGERYSPAVTAAITEAYEQTETIGDYMMYTPRAWPPQRP
jgi:hypothetical protein